MKGYKEASVRKTGDTMTGTLNIQYPNSDYPIINLLPKEGSKGGMLRFDGGTDKRRLYFSQYPSNSATYPETYLFPINTLAEDATEVKYYNIVTNKHPYLAHPVGTCVITSTNTNPSTILGGGTWSLIDKTMSYATFSIADMVTLNTTNCSASKGTITRCSDTIHIYGNFTPLVAITDSDLTMFTLDLSAMGISSIPSQMYSSMTDGGQAVFVYNISASGAFITKDIIVRGSSTASLAASYTLYYYCTIPVPLSSRMDSACNQFIWKRTA